MHCGEMPGAVSFPASSMHEGGEPFCYPCLAFKQRGLGRESRPWDSGTHTITRQWHTRVGFCSLHTGFCRDWRTCTELRGPQRHTGRWPRCVLGQKAIPGRGLPSSDGPPSGTEAGSVPCSAISSPVLPGKFHGGGWQAGPCLCPLPTALCPPQVPLLHHTQWLAAGCQLSSGLRFGLCAGFSPAAASGDRTVRGEARGCNHQAAPGDDRRLKPVDVEF